MAAALVGLAFTAAAQDTVGPARKAPAAAAPKVAPPTPGARSHPLEAADLETWLDGMVPYALKSGDIAGAVVVVVKDGKVLLQKGYGYSDVAAKTPMDPERTLVRAGSTSKLFTWTAVMQLVQAGKLDLNRDVNAYLDFKVPEPYGEPITLTDLMNHRGGFEEGLKDVLSVDPRTAQSTETYLKTHPRPMLFAPGETPAYSNYGAALAGYIVQRVSGEPFDAYVDRHILSPLGMAHSTFTQPLPSRLAPGMSKGYHAASGAPYPFELVVTAPAGSLSATASDMSRFMLAHLQNGAFNGYAMLSPQTTALMHSPSETPLRPGFATMAHGFFDATQNGRPVIGHGGDTIVFHSELDLLPQEGVGIFYNFNSRGAQDATYVARRALFDGFMDRYFPAPAPGAAPAARAGAKADAAEIAGLYQSSRRIEHGFLSFFYLLQQTPITAKGDGAITGPGALGRGVATFHEVGPQLWREEGGARELALTRVNGVKTVVDSDDPITVLQATPFLRSSSLNLPVLMASVAVLAWTVLLWALSPFLRFGERAASGLPKEARRARLWLRCAAAFDLAWLFAWFQLLQPVLTARYDAYGPGLDGSVATLEVLGFAAVAAVAVGVWAVWRMFRADAGWPARIWTAAVLSALAGVAWLGVIGQLVGLNLNY